MEFLGYHYWDDGSNSLGNQCLLFCIEHRMTGAKLASFIGISEMTMYRVENKEISISNETIVKVKSML